MSTALRRLPVVCLLLALFATVALAQTPPIRIMPMGDSITFGSGGTAESGGYRGTLYTLLNNAGYNVDFVGTQTGNSANLLDRDHQGIGGWRIDQLDANVAGWFNAIADPDVILLHIGTNDFGQGVDTANAINRLDALITKMATLRPYAHIIVTNLMERGEPQNAAIQAQFNPFVQDVVTAQAGLGRRVTFLDMRSAVPLADMPDNLHPNQTGYNKMAAAWLPAIQAVMSPEGDAAPPAISRARGLADRTHVEVTFTKPVADAAANPANFTISGGVTVSAAQLDASKRIVTLTTSTQTLGTTYQVTVNGVQDRITPTANTIAPNSTANFLAARPRGYLNNVPESTGYTLVYSLDIPSAAEFRTKSVPYSVDNRASIGGFDRVAYYLELQQANGDLQFAWVSMDAFTTDVGKVGVPTLGSGAQFQQNVANMNVVSNVVTEGTGLVGNLEFWPTNYQAPNSAGVAGASDSLFDFGDQPSAGNYGSMQVHHAAAAQTIFAFNNWGGNPNPGDLDLGIGNDPAPVTGGLDWTFHRNAATYTVKSLQVLVRTSNDVTPPAISSASSTFSRTKVLVSFSEPVAAGTVQFQNFSLNGGVSVLGVSLAANQRDVTLITTNQPVGTPLTLTVSGIRDTSGSANLIPPGTSIAVAEPALPAEIAANVGAAANGYHLVYSLDIPESGNLNSANRYRIDDRNAFGTFSRVAYYMELERPGNAPQYVWVSMDAFTPNRGKIGVPLLSTGAIFQQNVTNMEVVSNVAGVVNGTTATGGNIEFWPTDYSAPNGATVPNASGTTYDWGDTRTATGGFGSMQVHNHDASQVVFALNRFGVDGNVLDVGIGNQGTGNPDYTFASNAPSFSRRILHVLVLPGSTTPPAVVAKIPEAANYQLVYNLNIPATGNLTSGAGFTGYSVDNRNDVGGFKRVAYLMELQKTGDAQPNYVWVSMDAFTTNIARIGVPNLASGAFFQQNVANMNVFSNFPGIVTGTGIATGNIEFWPSNYTGSNAAAVPNASATNFDWGDGGAGTGGGYGSMQVHNYGASQVLFALNNWGAGANTTNKLCVGIGNNPAPINNGVDWTFAENAATFDVRRVLQVYVLPGEADLVAPTVLRARGSTNRERLVVTFSEPVADSAANVANFSIPGLTVTGATLLSGQRDVALTTSPQTAGTTYTVTVSGVRDRSSAGNVVAPGASATFVAHTTPALLSGIADTAGYQLIYHLEVPQTKPQWNVNTIPYLVDESKYGERGFDRVAYCFQLDGSWVYASFDPFTSSLAKIGVPTLGVSGTPFQQIVAHMNVDSNVPGIVTGSDIATGNIEFWGGNYAVGNALNIPNASATTFDFGDTMSAGGHGTMQIHNHGASQVLMAYNNWGNNVGGNSEMGIGTRAIEAPDYTNPTTALPTYTTRNLYVMARLNNTPTGAAPTIYGHPAQRSVTAGGSATFAVNATGATSYQWRRNTVPIPGETNAWLTISDAESADAGSYDVVASGPGGATTTSLSASLIYLNSPPTYGSYNATTSRNAALVIPQAALIAKGSDADGNTLTITAVSAASAQGGTVTLGAGTVTYTPPNGFVGADSFTVTLNDGLSGSVAGTVNISVTSLTPVPAGQVAFGFRADGKFDVLFSGTPGQNYHLQRSTDLTTGEAGWATIQTVAAGDDGLIPFLDANPPADHAYYRIQTINP